MCLIECDKWFYIKIAIKESGSLEWSISEFKLPYLKVKKE